MKHRYITVILIVALISYAGANNYVIINQIMYDSPLNEVVTTPPYSNGEFVELYNGGSSPVSLFGWRLSGDGITETFTIQDSITIASGGYVIIAYRHANTPNFQLSSLFSVPIDIPVLYQNTVVLHNGGETVTLRNASMQIVDRVYYDGTSHKTKPTRIFAENPDSISGSECVSLQRTWVEFDETGHAVLETDEWETATVTFGSNKLTQPVFSENYLTHSQVMPSGENYIISVTPLDMAARVSYTDGRPSVSSGIRTQTSIQYYDGFGRPVQTIALGQTPMQSDWVMLQQYTGLKRLSKKWLPVVAASEGQPQDESNITALSQNFYSDNRPYSETIYENSGMDRVINIKRPGNAWNNHPKSFNYEMDSEGHSVRKFIVHSGGLLGGTSGEKLQYDGTYSPCMLYKYTSADEDGISVITYTDKFNRTIMENRYGDETYYVYDDFNRLRYVLPPSCAVQLTTGMHNMETDIMLQQMAYCYQYDGVGNQIYKRLPGCEPQYMVYDALQQLVMKQDGNQRTANRWTVYAYDSIGRNIYSTEITTLQTHADLIAFYADKWQVEHFAKTAQPNALANTGYASTLMGTANAKILTVNYYDNYDFLDKLPTADKKELKYQQRSGYGYKHESAIGLLTGTRIYNLSDNSYIVTSYYYDYQGRIIQQRGTRHAGGYEESWFQYHHNGSLVQRLTEQKKDDWFTSETYRYTYDSAGRVITIKYTLNNMPEIELNNFSYDNLGRLAQNLRENKHDTIRYHYDMRGTLTDIQNSIFSENLFFADSLENGIAARFNGNVAAAYLSHPDSVYKFVYSYDMKNRLLSSNILMPTGNQIPSETLIYDGDGNIQSLQRYNGTTLIDDLLYTYKPLSNQLASIRDYAGSLDLSSIKEYDDNHFPLTEDDMEYDANGNMVSDRDRGIYLIKYNRLNLPDTIQFTNGNQIVNLYDATGTKYKSIYYTLLPTAATPYYEIAHYGFNSDTVEYDITEYTGSIVNHYRRNDTISYIYNLEGYFLNDTLNCYYRDHLGNNVAVRNMRADSIVQRTVYYASGLPMAQSYGEGVQPYKYNGKEFVEMHGLNEYDSHARWYYPAIMRTTTMDPLAEKYYNISPYAWCGNNMVNIIDPMGMDTIEVTYDSETEKWNLETPIVSEGDDVIYVVDVDGNVSEYVFSEGNYGERVDFLNIENTGDGGYVLGIYHVSGAKDGGTGFYVTPGGDPSNTRDSGKRINESIYPIEAPFENARWFFPGVGGDAISRGIRFHWGEGNAKDWTTGCFVLFSNYILNNGNISIIENDSKAAAVNFAHLLGGVGTATSKYKDRIGVVSFPYGVKDKLIIKSVWKK